MKTYTLANIIAIGAITLCSTIQYSHAGDAFAKARRSISNIVYSDSALPQTLLRPVFIYHEFPDQVNTTAGPVAMGGDLQLYALQFEYALNERLGLVALKDGYINYNPTPGSPFSSTDGFADLAAGLKYAFVYDEELQLVVSGKLMYELASGNTEVWQGNGKGSIDPSILFLKLYEDWQFSGAVGGVLPVDNDRSSLFYTHVHTSYRLHELFMPLFEFNYFRVVDDGNGDSRFPAQVAGVVPSIVSFEGSDLVNFGASNAEQNPDIATLAFGFRSRVHEGIDVGCTYEIPVTAKNDSLFENRITLDAVIRF